MGETKLIFCVLTFNQNYNLMPAMLDMLWLCLYFFVFIIKDFALGQDPCTDSGTKVLARNALHVPFCDASLDPTWYRIDEKTGVDMFTECVTFGTCGTVYPIWMDGSIPTQADGIVDRNACVVEPGKCCNHTYPIQVKNCGFFRVYKLMFTTGCYQAYCFKPNEEVSDCTNKGNFKCGGGSTKTLVAVSLVIVVIVLVIAIVVWCYFRRHAAANKRKPILSDTSKSTNGQSSLVHIDDPVPALGDSVL